MASEFQSSLDKSVTGLKALIQNSLKFSLARDTSTATKRDWWLATSKAVQSIIVERMIATATVHQQQERQAGLLSLARSSSWGASFPTASTARASSTTWCTRSRNWVSTTRSFAMRNTTWGSATAVLAVSPRASSTRWRRSIYPAIGYGIHYQYGLFKQEFRNGYQVELPDAWMQYGTPWEIVRPEHATEIQVYGYVENVFDDRGNYVPRWMGWKKLVGIPYDIPVPGYGTNTVNFLRLWESRAPEEFDFEAFNRGGYEEAVREKNHSETISKVLYPNDKTDSGKELRLLQQYFFVACSLKDIIRRFRRTNEDWEDFPEKVAIQLNDTHPAIAVVELLRLLHDEYGMPWDKAWSIVTRTFAYTNHTLLPEALEKWSVGLFQKVLPRHLQIIFEINKRFHGAKWKRSGRATRRRSRSSPSSKKAPCRWCAWRIFPSLAAIRSMAWPRCTPSSSKRISSPNSTLSIRASLTTRPTASLRAAGSLPAIRASASSSPQKSGMAGSAISTSFARLKHFADDPQFQIDFMAVKHANKVDLARIIKRDCGVAVNPAALFDVQIKRLHEYKRQHLNLLHILALYRRLLQNPGLEITPRVFIFAAKAAPGYDMAKCIIKAINAVGQMHQQRQAHRGQDQSRLPAELSRLARPTHRARGRSLRANLDGGQGSLRHRQHEALLSMAP